jgi:hypothetical protein
MFAKDSSASPCVGSTLPAGSEPTDQRSWEKGPWEPVSTQLALEAIPVNQVHVQPEARERIVETA